MATVRLTPRGVAAFHTTRTQEEVWDDVVPGLCLRVGRGGSKTFLVRYRANGKHRRLTLGRHPNLGLADARTKARTILADAQAGEDPAQVRETLRGKDVTFGALAREVLAALATSTRERTIRERKRIVETELLPEWKARPVTSITRRDVVQLVERIARRGAPVMANHVLGCIKTIFSTGIKRGFPTLEASPAQLVDPPAREVPRGRFLDRAELGVIWRATALEGLVPRTLFRVALLTAQRGGSIKAMKWADIDASDVWHIPAADFKGKRVHLVPLSAEVRAELAPLREVTGGDEYVFPGRADGRTKHLNSANAALRRLRKRIKIDHWTVHDFRTAFRTAATRAATPEDPRDPAGLGILPMVADAVLGHREASLGFSRYTGEQERYMLSEKREALARWGAFVLAAAKKED